MLSTLSFAFSHCGRECLNTVMLHCHAKIQLSIINKQPIWLSPFMLILKYLTHIVNKVKFLTIHKNMHLL